MLQSTIMSQFRSWLKTFLILLLIFFVSKIIVVFAFQLTADAKVVGNNYYRHHSYMLRYVESQARLNLPVEPIIQEIIFVAAFNPSLADNEAEITSTPLLVTINEDEFTTQTLILDINPQVFTITASGSALTSLDFFTPQATHDIPWSLKFITTDHDLFTNLLDAPQFDFSHGFGHFEDYNDNPSLSFSQYLTQWDAPYYLDIAQNGYQYDGNHLKKQNIAWPYLWPLTLGTASQIFPERTVSSLGVAINLILSFLNFGLIYLIAKRFIKDYYWRFLPVILFAFSPFAIFLSSLHSESLFIFCMLGFMLAFLSKHRFIASLFLFGATATRIVALPLILLFWIKDYLIDKRKLNLSNILSTSLFTVIGASGFLSFLFYIKFKFNTPFFDPLLIQQAWDFNVPGTASLFNVGHAILLPFIDLKNFIFETFYPGLIFNLFCLGITLFTLVYEIYLRYKKKNSSSFLLFYVALTSLLLMLGHFQSLLYQPNYTFGRYSLPLIPLCGIMLATYTQKKKTASTVFIATYLVLSSVLYFWYSISFMNGEPPF